MHLPVIEPYNSYKSYSSNNNIYISVLTNLYILKNNNHNNAMKNNNHNNITLHDINVKRSEKGKMFASVQCN